MCISGSSWLTGQHAFLTECRLKATFKPFFIQHYGKIEAELPRSAIQDTRAFLRVEIYRLFVPIPTSLPIP